jgi:PhnB protein
MALQPYLFFHGRCQEAIDFYRQAIGAELTMVVHFKDNPESHPIGTLPPGWGEKVMHANLRIGDATLLASDGHQSTGPHFEGFSLSLTVKDPGEAERKFNALAEGGQIRMPLAKTFFSPLFGMLTDRFGVGWMVYVAS